MNYLSFDVRKQREQRLEEYSSGNGLKFCKLSLFQTLVTWRSNAPTQLTIFFWKICDWLHQRFKFFTYNYFKVSNLSLVNQYFHLNLISMPVFFIHFKLPVAVWTQLQVDEILNRALSLWIYTCYMSDINTEKRWHLIWCDVYMWVSEKTMRITKNHYPWLCTSIKEHIFQLLPKISLF